MIKKSKICAFCGKKYYKNDKYSETQWSFSKYCSYSCVAKMKTKKALEKIQPTKICEKCGKIFSKNRFLSTKQWKEQRFCSNYCGRENNRKYKNNKEKDTAYRRRKGMTIKGSLEEKKKISELTKLAMQRPDVKIKIRQKRQPLSLKHRLKLSDIHKGKMPKNMMFGNNNNSCFQNIQRGSYDINGTTMYFRSKWEANYALFLDFLIDRGKVIKWEFEPDTFIFDKIKFGTRSYTPDFKVFYPNGNIIYHEVKGYMDSKSKTKLKRMKKYYKDIEVMLIDSKEYNLLKKQIGAICKFY